MLCPRCTNLLAEGVCVRCANPVDPLIGRVFGERYTLLRRLGEGGNGIVYEATQPEGERVAVKLLHASNAVDELMQERFQREVLVLRRLQHPCVVRAYESGQTGDGLLWMAMDFIDGQTLSQKICKTGPLSRQELSLFAPICELLEAAHQQGIYHRDLSSSNIMLSTKGPKVLDFGMASMRDTNPLTASTMISGTSAYMSPEQWQGLKNADHRSDIYALGVILYECVTGVLPFTANSPLSWMRQHCFAAPRPIPATMNGSSPALGHVVSRALAKNPDERQQSVKALKEEIIQALN